MLISLVCKISREKVAVMIQMFTVGPAAELGMFGMAKDGQVARGIYMRLYGDFREKAVRLSSGNG